MKTIKLALVMACSLAMTHTALADRIGGSGFAKDSVGAHQTIRYPVKLFGGQRARIAVSGDGDTDLDLVVLDTYGNRVAADFDLSDQCLVVFYPKWSGNYEVRVINNGSVHNNFTIVVE